MLTVKDLIDWDPSTSPAAGVFMASYLLGESGTAAENSRVAGSIRSA